MKNPLRWLSPIALAALAVPAPALATVEPFAEVRWTAPVTAFARAGEAFTGRFVIEAGAAGVVENLTIQGIGWTIEAAPDARAMVLAKGAVRSFEFRGRPSDPKQPIVVSFTFDGVPMQRVFELDEASRKPARGVARMLDGAPRVKPGGPTVDDDFIRLRGRVVYQRDDGVTLGVDNIRVRISDDDTIVPGDLQYEVMWEGHTDVHGWFDVTIKWDDCDIIGCDDPDLFFEIFADNAWVIAGHTETNPTQYWWWSGGFIPDYGGNDADFGTIMLPAADHGALHTFNSLTRSHRYGAAHGGMAPAQVSVLVPSANDNTSYNPAGQRIRIGVTELWNEGTHAHEYGHHLSNNFSVLAPSNYSNGFCDVPNPGHCVWCPENATDAWQEGWANWYGSRLIRTWLADYGITPNAINDNRYVLETAVLCPQDNTAYPQTITEGYVGMLLRDIEDFENDDSTPPSDCRRDLLSLGDGPIFTVFRDDDPTTVTDFTAKFRARYAQHDQNLWSTASHVGSAFEFAIPPPGVDGVHGLYCRVIRAGESVTLSVIGSGGLLVYRWDRDGVPLADGPGLSGTQTASLNLSSADTSMSGIYQCRVYTCDMTELTYSRAVNLTVQADPAPRPMVSWGANSNGQIGDGSFTFNPKPPAIRPVTSLVAVDGGHTFSAALHADGTVETWGYPANGVELGNGTSQSFQPLPAVLADLDSVMQVATGDLHTLVLRRDGTVWGWGWNGNGQIGDSTDAPRYVPTHSRKVEGCVRSIATGASHSLALLTDGTVLGWGYNFFGQLGRGYTSAKEIVPLPVPGLTDVVAIAAGAHSSAAVRADGTVWTWGQNFAGQLGDGTTEQRTSPVQVVGLAGVRAIAMGERASYAILDDGSCWSWGSNPSGLLGDGTWPAVAQRNTPGLMPGLVNPLKIEASNSSWTLALMSDGTVRMWGANDHHVLGRSTPSAVPTPTAVATATGEGPALVSGIGTGFGTAYAIGYMSDVLDAPETAGTPRVLALRAAPNPSFARTRIAFELPAPGRVSLAIYDLAGRRVRSLLDEFREPGRYDATWDGRGDGGGAGMAGVFFARLELNGMVLTERLVRIQ